LTESGDIAGRYDKRHLVPFGEYIPLSSSLLFFLDKFVVGIGDFIPGTGPLTLTLPQPPNQEKVRFGVAICFEVIFPDLVRRIAKEGADFLVTITNDAWFGDSVAPYQHFGMVVLRAVENRVAFARAANTGISGFIAPDGRIVKTTPIFTQEAVTGMIPLRTTTTFYSEHGDVFAWGCVIIAATLLWMARPTKRRQA
jgi:apolipoprotein N-acyltransferase